MAKTCCAIVLTLLIGNAICVNIFHSKRNDQQSKPSPTPAPQCGGINDNTKFDCNPEAGSDKKSCLERGCCWQKTSEGSSTSHVGIPSCFYPKNYPTYEYDSVQTSKYGYTAYLSRKPSSYSPYPKVVQTLRMDVYTLSQSTLRVKISDAQHERYEVPVPNIRLQPTERRLTSRDLHEFEFSGSNGFKVIRKSDKTVIFDTTVGNLMYFDQFLQISAKIPSKNIYGLGEHYGSLKHDTNWTRLVMFTADQPPMPDKSLYGSQPFYLNIEESGNCSGVMLFNSNAMEGPSPGDVISQYTKVVGRPFLPPYWSLGFHLCRLGYGSVNETRKIWKRNRDFGIPFDTQWNDIDFMSGRRDFTFDHKNYKTLPEFIKEIHKASMKYITIIDPPIAANKTDKKYLPYIDGLEMNVFIKNASGQDLLTKVWPDGHSVFPDFTNPKASAYWTKQMKRFQDVIPIDGAWLDMNEPATFVNGSIYGCPKNNSLENPPYLPPMDFGTMADKSLCMSAIQNFSTHYNLHNIYGLTQTIATNEAFKSMGKRPFIITRSTFVGSGYYAGHWSGDVESSWEQMKRSITSVLNFNMFGIPMVGADICGFNGNTTAALCQRWMELGAFYPFSRNHNTDDGIAQDPLAFGTAIANSSKQALTIRYTLLPYLYTLFYRSHVYGETVARPMFFEYNMDQETYGLDTQFMLGPAILILPVLEENATSVKGYFPRDVWFNYDQKTVVNQTFGAAYKTIDTPAEKINVYFRAGFVIPTQIPSVTTTQSKLNDYQLIVTFDISGKSSGNLYLDDGEYQDPIVAGIYTIVKFAASRSGWFYSNTVQTGYNCRQPVRQVTFLGMGDVSPKSVMVNGKPAKFTYDENTKVMVVSSLKLSLMQRMNITWK
ncbi:Lysosomal alpha-glucosidase [Nymphon striatum]|nr:Lysosomal alpha-glucosidase [Nymphon striatum]